MALYEREVKQDKKFPPGMSEPAKRNFTPQQWAKFKELERRLQVGSVTMEEAQEQMRKMVQYLNDAPAMREEEAKKREALRALKLY